MDTNENFEINENESCLLVSRSNVVVMPIFQHRFHRHRFVYILCVLCFTNKLWTTELWQMDKTEKEPSLSHINILLNHLKHHAEILNGCVLDFVEVILYCWKFPWFLRPFKCLFVRHENFSLTPHKIHT